MNTLKCGNMCILYIIHVVSRNQKGDLEQQ